MNATSGNFQDLMRQMMLAGEGISVNDRMRKMQHFRPIAQAFLLQRLTVV
jgi:hypothetical protein